MFLPPFQAADPTVPANVVTVATAYGRGVQIYACALEGTAWHWVFQSPEATLVSTDALKPVATHSAGPTWTWSDGSTVTGKVLQQAPAADPANIPSLLLTAAHPAGTPQGLLSPVTLIRRSDTQAGAAPAGGCDAGHAATVIRVPYTATYTFYRADR
jgi:hypothetical protein